MLARRRTCRLGGVVAGPGGERGRATVFAGSGMETGCLRQHLTESECQLRGPLAARARGGLEAGWMRVVTVV